jgi:hypothetical protein
VEHRVHPVENGADPEEARKADVDKYKQWMEVDALIMA